MSGDLRTPQKSIVYGSFGAIIITLIIYLAAILAYSLLNPQVFQIFAELSHGHSPQLTELFGLGQPFPRKTLALIVLIGILVATASSGLSLFITGPRTLQSIIYDGLMPNKWQHLAGDFRKSGSEPRRATILSLFMALVIIWAGDLSFAATLVGILFFAGLCLGQWFGIFGTHQSQFDFPPFF